MDIFFCFTSMCLYAQNPVGSAGYSKRHYRSPCHRFQIFIQITPIVAAVPNDVPVRKDVIEHRRKAANSMSDGIHISDA